MPEIVTRDDLERLLADVRAVEAQLVARLAEFKAREGRRVEPGAPAPMTRLR